MDVKEEEVNEDITVKDELTDCSERVLPSSGPIDALLTQRCLKKELPESEDKVKCPCEECIGSFWVTGEGGHRVKVEFDECEPVDDLPDDNIEPFFSDDEALEDGEILDALVDDAQLEAASGPKNTQMEAAEKQEQTQEDIAPILLRRSLRLQKRINYRKLNTEGGGNWKEESDDPKFKTDTKLTSPRPRPFICSALNCGASFLQSWHLKKHQQTHSGRWPFRCFICGKVFNDKFNCKRHRETQHSIEAGSFVIRLHICRICRKAFTQRSLLQDHRCLSARRGIRSASFQ